MKERKKRKPVLFWIFFALTALLAVALFELGKNVLWGWALLLLLLAAWIFLRLRVLPDKSFLLRLGCFVGVLAAIGVAFVISGPREKAVPAVRGKDPRVTEIRTVAQGQLTGVCTEDEAVEVYAGIPYAKPPVGALRWKEPQPPEAWEGVRVCDHFAPMSMQPRNLPVVDSLMQIERKAIGRNIDLLRDAGVEIESKRGGSYIDSREFEDSELRMLIDDVQ